eukprot:TRINITY_DN3098_c0_g1_i3.p1 TRINITY_DN3098_c0_g1~~TRINITY_DN3098_c0_g1_i3.p1  ORF type:complete len:506 (-),score=103.62 TRINITY_DN3098_c0_g1_i3:32-1462(-)
MEQQNNKSTEADKLKEEANKQFGRGRYSEALELYSKAIELVNDNAILYSNRAFCHIKLENYGSAIADATKSIELDPKYIKGYYRRGTANLALAKYKLALTDFKKVVQIAPNEKDAVSKLQECDKAVRRAAFEAAIAHESTASPFDTLDLNLEIESSYDGPHLPNPITLEFIQQMMLHFKDQKKIHKKYVYQILSQVRDLLKKTPTLIDIQFQPNEQFTVCGDTHGQYYDLLNIFKLTGLPSTSNPILFNGDFVDRGSFSAEVILTLFAFKLLLPNHFHLTRGNHEGKSMNRIYGFEGEIKAKYGELSYKLFAEVFCCLPLAAVINSKVLVVHGGLFSKDGVTLDDIRKINRFCEPPDEGLMTDILWSDPQPTPGRAPSKRGVGVSFGEDVTRRFLAENSLELLIRSHEVRDEGYQIDHGGKCITIFSAPNYCDQMQNKGAFLRLNYHNIASPTFTTYTAVEHPKVPPMAYASSFFR